MKRILLLCLTILLSPAMWAQGEYYDFCEDGIYYSTLSNGNCTVMPKYYGSEDNNEAYKGDIEIPEWVTHNGATYHITMIYNFCFAYCRELTSLKIPESVTTIAEYAFWNCENLQSVNIPEGITWIRACTFWGCSSLPSLVLPNSVVTIDAHAIRDCTNLQSVTIGNNLEEMGAYAFYNSGLLSVELPESLKSCGVRTFQDCSNLTSANIPNSITDVDIATFMDCTSLKTVILGVSVEVIHSYAFQNCTSLREVYSLNPEPPTCEFTSFSGASLNRTTVYVPKGSLDAYYAADTWSEFYMKKEITASSIITLEVTDITDTSAILSGSITEGTLPITEKGFEYWAENGEVVTVVAIGDDFTVTLTDLSGNTTYAYRAYAIDASGATYGEVFSFTTLYAPSSFECIVDPESGSTLDVLSTISVSCEDGITRALIPDEEITIVDSEGNHYDYSVIEIPDDTGLVTRVNITLYPEIVFAGVYTVNIPVGYFDIGNQMNEAMTLEYTVTGAMDGISSIHISENVEGYYTISGQKVNTLVKGVNIVKSSDGSVKKLYVK